MRVLIVDPYYPAFLDRHYRERPELADASYDEQHASLMDACFGTADAYSRGFRRLGHEAAEVIPNCAPLQLRWAAERGVAPTLRRVAQIGRASVVARAARSLTLPRILTAQIEEFDPDVVYFQSLSALPPAELARLRGAGRLVVGQIASPAPSVAVLRSYELITTSFPHFVERFRALGIDTEYLRIAFHTPVIEKLEREGHDVAPGSKRPYAVTFVGAIDPSVHPSGTAFLEQLCERREINVWGFGAGRLLDSSPLLRRYQGEAWGLEMYAVMACSRIAINRHIDAAESYSNNMRMFEATGTGALLMTEASENLGQIFEPDEEVVPYCSVEDLVEKIDHYLSNDAERERIAAAGQHRTLTEHTYDRRIEELEPALEQRVARRRAYGRRPAT